MRKIAKFIQKIDILVKPYEFRVSNRKKNSTYVGGIITLAIIIFGAFYYAQVFMKTLNNDNIIYAGT